jgi:hypothetical protein
MWNFPLVDDDINEIKLQDRNSKHLYHPYFLDIENNRLLPIYQIKQQ